MTTDPPPPADDLHERALELWGAARATLESGDRGDLARLQIEEAFALYEARIRELERPRSPPPADDLVERLNELARAARDDLIILTDGSYIRKAHSYTEAAAEIARLRQKLGEAEAARDGAIDRAAFRARVYLMGCGLHYETADGATRAVLNLKEDAGAKDDWLVALTLAQSQRDVAEAIGVELERAIAQARLLPALKSWTPADCPTEIVGRLIHLVEDAQSQRDALATAAEPVAKAKVLRCLHKLDDNEFVAVTLRAAEWRALASARAQAMGE